MRILAAHTKIQADGATLPSLVRFVTFAFSFLALFTASLLRV